MRHINDMDYEKNYDSEGLDDNPIKDKAKKILLIGAPILLVIILCIVFMSGSTSKLSSIKAEDNYDLFRNEESTIYIDFVGVKSAKKVNYKVVVSDKEVVDIKQNVISNDKLKLVLSPKSVGKTELKIKANEIEKSVDLLVCNKITSKDLSTKTIYMKSGSTNKLLLDSGGIPECAEKVKIESTNNDIVEVEDDSIKSVKNGQATVKIAQGENKLDLKVTVSDSITLLNKIVLNDDQKFIEVSEGESKKITYKMEPENTSNKFLLWESSDESVAHVSQNGTVEGIKVGNAIVTVSSTDGSNVKATIMVIVKDKNNKTKNSITLATDNLELFKEDEYKIEYTILDSLKFDSIVFTSEDDKIASVDKNGVIKAKAPGTINITVTAMYGEYEMYNTKMKLTVLDKVDGINVKQKTINMYVNDSKVIEYEIVPKDIEYTSLTFESSDEKIVTVSDSGVIKAIKNGNAEVTMTLVNKNNSVVKASIKVTVGIKPTSISLKDSNVSIYKDNSYKIEYSILPNGSKYESVEVKSNDTGIATIDNNGVIKGIKAGNTNVVIKVTCSDGSVLEQKVKVVVKERVNARSITINGTYNLDFNEPAKLKYTIYPSNAEIKSISFKSSNTDVLTVSDSGEVIIKGVNPQKATVIVTNYDNTTVQASVDVKMVPSITISQVKSTNVTSNSATLSAYFTNSKNKNISEFGVYIWESTASKPNTPTYKTTTNYSNKTLSIDTKNMNKTLTAGKIYKYVFYVKTGNVTFYSDYLQFTTLALQSISFSRAYAAVQVGSSYKLPINTNPSNLSVTPTYSSANTGIATVDAKGNVTGKSTGETTITATYGNLSAKIKVRVIGAVSKSKPATLYDISEYNTISSWSKMKSNGINYLILRMGITSTFNGKDTRVDSSFANYVKNARANNIEIGVYYYSKATTTANVQNEANFVLKTLNSYSNGTFSLPVFIDYEEENQPKNQTGANLISSFCDVIEKGGYYCGAYMSYAIFSYNLSSSVKARWVPDWTCGGKYANSVKNMGIWQFAADTSDSCLRPTVYGINFADSNYMYIDYASQIINSGLNKFK